MLNTSFASQVLSGVEDGRTQDKENNIYMERQGLKPVGKRTPSSVICKSSSSPADKQCLVPLERKPIQPCNHPCALDPQEVTSIPEPDWDTFGEFDEVDIQSSTAEEVRTAQQGLPEASRSLYSLQLGEGMCVVCTFFYCF